VSSTLPRIINERNLTLAELREILEKEERVRELTNLERYTLEYARRFSKENDPQRARAKVEELIKTFDIPEDIAVQLVNLKPQDPGEIRLVFLPLSKVFSEEDYKRILEIVNSE
jgi:DNA-directed RNA polymerase subunit F